jgi:hypothetical protein
MAFDQEDDEIEEEEAECCQHEIDDHATGGCSECDCTEEYL